jgi:thioredoxin 1
MPFWRQENIGAQILVLAKEKDLACSTTVAKMSSLDEARCENGTVKDPGVGRSSSSVFQRNFDSVLSFGGSCITVNEQSRPRNVYLRKIMDPAVSRRRIAIKCCSVSVPFQLTQTRLLQSLLIFLIGRISVVAAWMPIRQVGLSRGYSSSARETVPIFLTPPTTFRRIQPISLKSSSGGSQSKSGGRLIRTFEEFQQLVLASPDMDHRPSLVFFTAPWCGPCRLTIPVVKDMIKKYGVGTEVNDSEAKMNFYEVCTDDLPEAAAESGVVSIPTIQMYGEGKLLDTIVGSVAKNVLNNAIEKVLEDIQLRQVRRQGSLSRRKAVVKPSQQQPDLSSSIPPPQLEP